MEDTRKGLTPLKLSQILSLDLRNDGALETLNEALYKLPFFKDETSIEIEAIETAIKKMQKKYPIKLAYININTTDDEDEPPYYYSCMIKRTDDHKHVKTIWGVTLYEAMAKVALLMFGYIQSTLKKEGTQ